MGLKGQLALAASLQRPEVLHVADSDCQLTEVEHLLQHQCHHQRGFVRDLAESLMARQLNQRLVILLQLWVAPPHQHLLHQRALWLASMPFLGSHQKLLLLESDSRLLPQTRYSMSCLFMFEIITNKFNSTIILLEITH